MSATDRPNFLSQPVVKSVHLYRNGDPYFQGRKIVVNEKRVCNFESFLKEATSGVQASFGAVRNIYTPSEGHRVDALEELESGQHYVAAGREKFKKLDYLQIGSKKKNSIQNSNIQTNLMDDSQRSKDIKPVAHSRIVVSARFLRPIQEPCAIFLVANGDVLNMPVRLLIPRKILAQWEHILEMVTEKMRVRILGAVHSLFTFDGKHIMEAKDLENGQFYVAVGRERFKKLAYSDLLFTKPAPIRRYNGSKAASLPPLYRYENHKEGLAGRQSKSTGGSSDASPQPPKRKGKKEQLSPAEEVGLHGKPVRVKWKRNGITAPIYHRNSDKPSKAYDERPESRDAGEVEEAEFLQVDIPVDQRAAEIVNDEEYEESHDQEYEENCIDNGGDPEVNTLDDVCNEDNQTSEEPLQEDNGVEEEEIEEVEGKNEVEEDQHEEEEEEDQEEVQESHQSDADNMSPGPEDVNPEEEADEDDEAQMDHPENVEEEEEEETSVLGEVNSPSRVSEAPSIPDSERNESRERKEGEEEE
ncbi:doublecortin domain-containing protein 2-like isoform X9 [Erpetoichthys calabaricus]|uniref:doublecortin domain-containing protein 2-like isoform X1 n=1 Tax=Erpetoichthys calabaricus TaxID=27687 RepID=UPI002234E112|nr:doublecortin domain-containing protein 2-like isoform X1 [Erpetoichthys calabaricus]XP_051791695.1 doublecortin domain-containing protein 2-like isoform X2 [Erpetoichthys calabaricus]XP_051791696.1 doublecortin domain-containing protein 2-like isoform X3 [Erpetoichthys calabaricus]XP_051791697.1 doublecortin domain-containing protein 2-like isoform X4 [Erpetoichthys calabaricus]XP_051791698.1 doublecortin domain-containing protein 2-like isoform X5 [Erpetoichthys calabaricus]XP_051791699.1 